MRRIGRLAFLGALFTALASQLAHAQQPQTQMFAPPTLHGVVLDWCAHFGRDCGKPAADLFCHEMHFDQATSFSIDQNAGQRGISTLVFGDGSLCQGAQCSGFRQITCARAVAAQPETPRTFAAPPTIAAPPPTVTPPPTIAAPPRTLTPQPPSPPPPAVVQPLRPIAPPPPLPPTQAPPAVVAQPPAPPSTPPPALAEPPPRVPLPHISPSPPEIATQRPQAPPVAAQPVRPHIAALDPTEVAKLPMGDIHLVAPEVVPAYDVEIPNPNAGAIPVWDDETVFKWKPSNPNMADTYEMRFYNAFNTAKPLATARVPGNQIYKHTSIQFLQELLTSAGIKPGPNDDFWSLLWNAAGAKQGNLLWEVAGYRNYANSGVAQGSGGDAAGDTTEVQVAVSERWPLRAPDRANGYGACGPNSAPGIQTGSLDLFNYDAAHEGDRPQGVDYVYDLMQVRGAFSLANSPYASHPKEIMAPPQPGALINITVASYQFDNLFIDWGDGDVEPLTVQAVDQSQWDRSAPLALPDNAPAHHRYLSAGSYYIRIFQVSEQDLQKVNVSALNLAHQVNAAQAAVGGGPSAAGGSQAVGVQNAAIGGYYGALIGEGGGGAGPSGPIAEAGKANVNILQGGFPLDVANRAYVVYCAHLAPTEPMDDVAFGDLNLYSADIAFDDSHAVDKNNPVEGRVAACDELIKARVSLKYIGKGTVTVTWKVGDVVVGVYDHEIGPSPSRNAIELKAQAPPNKGTWLSDWQSLPVAEAMIGAGQKVTVEIKVKDKPKVTRLMLRPGKQGNPDAPPVISAVIKVIQTLGA